MNHKLAETIKPYFVSDQINKVNYNKQDVLKPK